jgi:hypothetical protein
MEHTERVYYIWIKLEGRFFWPFYAACESSKHDAAARTSMSTLLPPS